MAAINYEIPVLGRLLTVAETARALGMSEKTIRNWLCVGKMKFFKINTSVRIAESEVLQILARGHRLEGKQ
jgi:excisionase family DNA binding protein